MKKDSGSTGVAVLFGALLALGALSAAGADVTFRPAARSAEAPTMLGVGSTVLSLDDGSAEGAVGVAVQNARQFLWFNRFSPPGNFDLDAVEVLFLPDPRMAVGDAIQIAIYVDADGNPANGAALARTLDAAIQALDGVTPSVYPVDPPVFVPAGSDLLVGVVPRFITSGVTPPTFPAAIDTGLSQGRSWLAIWGGDPPDPPQLTPAPGQYFGLIDSFQPGNWMIRAAGGAPPVQAIPALGPLGAAALAFALAALAARRLRRRPGEGEAGR